MLRPGYRNANSRYDNASPERQVDAEPCAGDEERLALVVHRTLNDTNRRKRNVVVSGLPESQQDDRLTFLSLCEDNLTIKPFVAENGCRCIGTSNPRKLLVRLRTEDATTELLRAAPKLRQSTNAAARQVYINEDLSPAAAKLAYEARKLRREKRYRQPSSDDVTTQINSTDNHVQTYPAPAQSTTAATRTETTTEPINGVTSIAQISSQQLDGSAIAKTSSATVQAGAAQPLHVTEASAGNINAFHIVAACVRAGHRM